MALELGPADLEALRGNLERIRSRIGGACARAGRDPAGVTLVAVTKYAGPTFARGLLGLGQLDLGENRTDHLLALDAALADGPVRPRWHMVGHLQRNKARDVADRLHTLHSLDSPDLLRRLEALRDPGRAPLRAFVEVRLDPKETRSGVEPERLAELLAALPPPARVRRVGLMGLPPQGTPEEARVHFRRLRELLDRAGAGLEERGLSMGMTDDLEVAVEEGATVVRVGRALLEGLSPEALA